MIGELSQAEIDALLKRQRIGRIGSTSVGHVQITPIIYGYDGDAIFGHSRFGRKIQYMRGNPEVCFEVEEISGPDQLGASLRSRGAMRSYKDPGERDRAMRFILAQAGGGPESSAVQVERGADLVIYRIRIDKRSGRTEGGIEDA